MARCRRLLVILLVTVPLVGCDQATKTAAKSYLSGAARYSFTGDTVRLQYSENPGGFLGLGGSPPEAWRTVLFTGSVGATLVLLATYLVFAASARPTKVLALSLIFAGGSSNLADRIAYDGRVIDFINIGLGPIRTGIFNVADVAIALGILLFMLRTRRQLQRQRTGVGAA